MIWAKPSASKLASINPVSESAFTLCSVRANEALHCSNHILGVLSAEQLAALCSSNLRTDRPSVALVGAALQSAHEADLLHIAFVNTSVR